MLQGIRLRLIEGETEKDVVFTRQNLTPLDIGRSATENGLALNAKGVSRQHCRISLIQDTLYIEDLDSTSGTYCMGQKITVQHPLNDGDRISIGPVSAYVHFNWEDAPSKTRTEPEVPISEPTAPDPHPAKRSRPVDNMAMTMQAADAAYDDSAPLETARIDLIGDRLVLGRDSDCDITLDHLMISRRHVEFYRKGRAWLVRDLGATNGTFVNGQRLRRPFALDFGDILKLGPYQLVFEGSYLVSRQLDKEGIRISIFELSKVVKDRRTRKPILLLDDINLTIHPGEFVALLGPSGCGKSTLMEAMNGRQPGTDGNVLYNGTSIYDEFDAYRTHIGYVPQELIFHDALPLADALRYNSRLRLPQDVSDSEIEDNITDVLDIVGLADRRQTVIRQLSGGQKKRVCIAVELLSKPSVLFLDEVTSGLDAYTEREMMKLFRKLADNGVTVVCISHYLDNLNMCDKLVALMAGHMVFAGPFEHLLHHFKIPRLVDFFDQEKKRPALEWRSIFEQSPYWQHPEHRDASGPADRPPDIAKTWDVNQFKAQLKILTKRYAQLITLDRIKTGTLIALAPLIAVFLSLLASSIDYTVPFKTQDDYEAYGQQQGILAFGSIIIVMFLAMFGAIQEVVSEIRVYRHERFVTLQILPYMVSKIIPLTAVNALQCVLVAVTVNMAGQFELGNLLGQLIILLSVGLAGTTLGLAISAAVPEQSQGRSDSKNPAVIAVMIMNAFVIAQVLFSGSIAELTGLAKHFGQILVSGYWAYQAFQPWLNDKLPSGARAYPDAPALMLSVSMILLHALTYGLILFVAMVRKDGPGGFAKLAKAIPRDEKGRIAAKKLIDKAKAMVYKSPSEV